MRQQRHRRQSKELSLSYFKNATRTAPSITAIANPLRYFRRKRPATALIRINKGTYLTDGHSDSDVDAGADVLRAGKLSFGIIRSVIGRRLRLDPSKAETTDSCTHFVICKVVVEAYRLQMKVNVLGRRREELKNPRKA